MLRRFLPLYLLACTRASSCRAPSGDDNSRLPRRTAPIQELLLDEKLDTSSSGEDLTATMTEDENSVQLGLNHYQYILSALTKQIGPATFEEVANMPKSRLLDDTPLERMVRQGRAKELQARLAETPPDHINGWRLISLAIGHGFTPIVQLLLEAGHVCPEDYDDVLNLATRAGSTQTIKWLVQAKVGSLRHCCWTPLLNVVARQDYDLLHYVLRTMVQQSVPKEELASELLHLAIKHSWPSIIDALVDTRLISSPEDLHRRLEGYGLGQLTPRFLQGAVNDPVLKSEISKATALLNTYSLFELFNSLQ